MGESGEHREKFPPRWEPWGGWGSDRVSRLLPASAGFFGEARDASRSPGAALRSEASKRLRTQGNAATRANKEPSKGLGARRNARALHKKRGALTTL